MEMAASFVAMPLLLAGDMAPGVTVGIQEKINFFGVVSKFYNLLIFSWLLGRISRLRGQKNHSVFCEYSHSAEH